jgi:prepilin-type N-terminal cleavage/methylation domain-containing protein
MNKNVRRRGFTLPEVLVTITIVAVLAAVVVPAVLNQVNKGDTAGLAGDVDALRSAISNFTTDTRHYPASIEDLISAPASTDDDLFLADYGATAVNAWKGPYFPTSQSVSGTATYATTAFGLAIQNAFRAPHDTTGNFITLVFTTFPTPAQIATIDRLFDGGTGLVPAGTGTGCDTTTPTATGANSGQIRWTQSSSGACTITAMSWRLVSAAQ